MARTNVTLRPTPIFTHEGAKASKIDAVAQLRRSVLACLLWEDTFYESGESIADRITQEVANVLKLKNGADIVANLAVEARSKFKLRHAPLHLVNALVAANTEDSRSVVSGALYHAIQRPDEINEFLAQYWRNGKRPIPNQVKKGLAAAFTKFDEYSLGKYANREAQVKLRDALFLVHAKPKNEEQESLFRKLADNELKAPQNTWEVQLSSGRDKKEVFSTLLAENDLGALALLRNLRNASQAGVDESSIRSAIRNMRTDRVLPFRFITAARYAPQFEAELETAMFKCLDGFEKLSGKTTLVVDHSGSMNVPLSSKSELTRFESAAALAMLLREVCEEVEIIAFSNQAKVVRPRRGFALRDELNTAIGWGGTNTETALSEAASRRYDRIIVITDEQSHQNVSNPQHNAKGYFVNVASYRNGIGYGAWTHLDGFSEAIVNYIQAIENQN